jgi:hypothetical protein
MAIRQIKKSIELPPAHLYLEDIEEIVELMTEVSKNLGRGNPEVDIGFKAGKKECDTLDDLKQLGGSWRRFEARVGSGSFTIDPFWGTKFYVPDQGHTFDRVLRLTTIREAKFRSLLLGIPWEFMFVWFWLSLYLFTITPHSKPWMIQFSLSLSSPWFLVYGPLRRTPHCGTKIFSRTITSNATNAGRGFKGNMDHLRCAAYYRGSVALGII